MSEKIKVPLELIKRTLYDFEENFTHKKILTPIWLSRTRGEIESSAKIYNHDCFEKSLILAQKLLEAFLPNQGLQTHSLHSKSGPQWLL